MTPDEYAAEARKNGLERFDVVDDPAEVMDVEEYLDRETRMKRERLEAELEAINQQIGQREELHKEIVGEIEIKLERYEQELERMGSLFRGGEEGREEMRQQIRSLQRQLHPHSAPSITNEENFPRSYPTFDTNVSPRTVFFTL